MGRKSAPPAKMCVRTPDLIRPALPHSSAGMGGQGGRRWQDLLYRSQHQGVRQSPPLTPPPGSCDHPAALRVGTPQATTWEKPVMAPPVAPAPAPPTYGGGGGGGGWGAPAPAPPPPSFPEFNPNITPTFHDGGSSGDKWDSFMAQLSISSDSAAFSSSAPSASAVPPNEPDTPICSGCGIKVRRFPLCLYVVGQHASGRLPTRVPRTCLSAGCSCL
jgi:hypothetical protein